MQDEPHEENNINDANFIASCCLKVEVLPSSAWFLAVCALALGEPSNDWVNVWVALARSSAITFGIVLLLAVYWWMRATRDHKRSQMDEHTPR